MRPAGSRPHWRSPIWQDHSQRHDRATQEPVTVQQRGGVKLIITPFEEVPEDRSGYTIAFDDERCEEIDVHIYWDKRQSTCEGIYLLKVSGTEWDVRFLVLSNADELPADRFSRIGMGNWHRSSYENPPRPFAESTPQQITLV